MAGKFSRKKQETGASWILGAVLIALLDIAFSTGIIELGKAVKNIGK